eukprot:m.74091 g.74091  ORF g.74091 m.74091 type:complete len:320 (+) comp16146_c0_seq1:142-1101(+)
MATIRHFRSVLDFTPAEMVSVLKTARRLKRVPRRAQLDLLPGMTMGMIFEKPSLRTHTSFETGMSQMGGHATYLGPSQIGDLTGTREPVKDISNVLTRMCDIVIARVFKKSSIYELAEHAHCPIINALCDMEHPCQAMADLLTIMEHKGDDLKGLKLTFIGDGNNNVTHSLALSCAMMGMDFAVAAPTTNSMDPTVSEQARAIASESGSTVTETTDAFEAVANADVVYTDTFVSMGDEANKAAILKNFDGFQVDDAVMAGAKPDAVFMHDMPAYRGIEVTSSVIDGPQSIIYDQAENRQHAQKAVVLHLMGVDVQFPFS